ncbi:MAG: LLM class F420-dependent oxidoreductase [Halieaceae bacterium]|jgi:probable F420-dependent oxidoreductase|nr:LLM class F420-dependent oxidoreductase [Halieaceae bacterium]
MKIGLIPVNIGFPNTEAMISFAQQAEAAGVESLWTFEHVIVPMDYESKYPYDKSGKMAITPETNFVDPLICLSAVAAATRKVRLGTGVNILSQANPLYMAKQAAGIDFLSNGRFMLGVGIGWLEEEFNAVGVPFARRGARFDDYVQAMRKVWSGEVVEHQSDFIQWTNFKSFPLPVQDPLPVIIGGDKGKVYQRIAKYGNGWYAPTRSPEDLAPRLQELKAVCEEEGRNYDDIEITAMWTLRGGLDELKAYQDLGVARLNVPLAAMGEANPADGLDRLHSEVLSQVA